MLYDYMGKERQIPREQTTIRIGVDLKHYLVSKQKAQETYDRTLRRLLGLK